MTAREASLKILNRTFKDRAYSRQVIESCTSELSDRDKALASRISLGVMQNYILLDYFIDDYCTRLDLPIRNILRIGSYQILFMDKIPVSAAVNECVELTKKNGFKSASGLVNAVLRKITTVTIPDNLPMYIKYSHPKWFVDKMINAKGEEFTELLLKENNKEPEIDYHKGFNDEFYAQDKAAYESVMMLDPKPGMQIMDACAAPGGKSFTSAIMMNNSGEILSCDIHDKKLKLVRDGAERLGITIIDTVAQDASKYNDSFYESFDCVIADVPCSGFGVIRKKPDIRFKTEEEVSRLPELQRRILSNLIKYVKPGGRLLYSTCTVFEEENENITFGYNVINQKTFYPNVDGTDGFYASVILK